MSADLGQPRLFVDHGARATLGDPSLFEQKLTGLPAFVRPLPKEPEMSVAESLGVLTLQIQLLRVDVAEIKTRLLAPRWYDRVWAWLRDVTHSLRG